MCSDCFFQTISGQHLADKPKADKADLLLETDPVAETILQADSAALAHFGRR